MDLNQKTQTAPTQKIKRRRNIQYKLNQELNAQDTDWAQVHQKLKQSHTLSAVCLRQPHILSVASSSFISLPQISSDTNIEIPEDTRHTSIFRDLEISILPVGDLEIDNRKAPVVALVKALVAVRGASGTATLLQIRDHHRIRFYNSNTSRSKPAQTGKRKRKKSADMLCSPLFASSLEAAICCALNEDGVFQEVKRIIKPELQSFPNDHGSTQNFDSLVQVHLGESSRYDGYYVELLHLGDSLPMTMPIHVLKKWEHSTVLANHGRQPIYLRPNVRGRTIFSHEKGSFQWHVRMHNDPSNKERHGSPVFELFEECPDKSGLVTRRKIGSAPSASAMWQLSSATAGLSQGPELLGLHHESIVLLIQIANGPDGAVGSNAAPKKFKTQKQMSQLDERHRRTVRSDLSSAIDDASRAICPNDPDGAVVDLVKNKRFRAIYGLDDNPTAQQLFRMPFVVAEVHRYKTNKDPQTRVPILSK